MTVTITSLTGVSKEPQAIGQLKAKFFEMTGDTSYPTGGTVLTADRFGLSKIVRLQVDPASNHLPAWDRANNKLLVYTGALVEVTNATDLSGTTFFGVAWGYD